MELTDKIDYATCKKIYTWAREYGERSVRDSTIKKLRKQNKGVLIKRVNTPEKIPVLYIYLFKKKHDFTWFTFVELKGEEGSSFLCGMANSWKYVIIKSHLISRFIERHGWNGDRQSCEEYILMKTYLLWYDVDKYTKEINAYFEKGMLLGTLENDIYVMRTYIDESVMHTNQKIKAKWQELKILDAKKIAELKFNRETKEILDCFDEIEMSTRKNLSK